MFLGLFLLTKLLTPILISTAQSSPESHPRVIWVSSSGTEIAGLESQGLSHESLDTEYYPRGALERYGLSKAGNWLHGVEFARRFKGDGLVSVPLNPGNLSSELYREWGFVLRFVMKLLLQHKPVMGAYTELFAGLSEEVTVERSGDWGEFVSLPFFLIEELRVYVERG